MYLAIPAIFTVVMIGLAAYHETGRTKITECVEERVLFGPGTWNEQWCIEEWDEWTTLDDDFVHTDRSGYRPVQCYPDEAAAREACENGVKATESR